MAIGTSVVFDTITATASSPDRGASPRRLPASFAFNAYNYLHAGSVKQIAIAVADYLLEVDERMVRVTQHENANMTLIVAFPGTNPQSEHASVAVVGGKGHSLIRMISAGLPVPPGAVLTTQFFAPWFEEVKRTDTWTTLVTAALDEWLELCDQLKRLVRDLTFTGHQRQALECLRTTLATEDDHSRFAVRSSSPDEDLLSASFAGGYETRLGVRPTDFELAIRHCFASSLDQRVFAYKRQHGFDVFSPRIAVIVQQQIDSEVAGVGFSLNPLTNDYDEAVIDANWGLGESVVAGLASPDHFVVDKCSRKLIDKHRGAKQVSHWLDDEVGTVEQANYRAADLTLNDGQLSELTDMVCRIEELFEHPVDIEWAFADDQLHVLQARSITTYVPLPPEMMTQPGQWRRLYVDIGLSNGITINAPISPMGLDWMADCVRAVFEHLFGMSRLELSLDEGFLFFAGGRMYQDLSNMMWLISPQRLGKGNELSDALMAATIANIDVKQYRAPQRPPWAGLRILLFLPRVMWRSRHLLWNTARCIAAPQRARRWYQRNVDAFESELTTNVDYDMPLDEFRQAYVVRVVSDVLENTMPALGAWLFTRWVVDFVIGRNQFDANGNPLSEKLKLGLTGNVVVEMGIALYRMAKLLDRSEFTDVARLAQRIDDRQVSVEFLDAWDAFLATYGCRGPLEMDVATPRYADDPQIALRQMSFMAVDDVDFDPDASHQRQIAARRGAYDELMTRLGWFRRALLKRCYVVIDLFGGTRDTPKHQNLLLHQANRKRAVLEGQRLVQEGRLDSAEDIFDLRFADLQAAIDDPELDLRAVRDERTRFLQRLAAQVTEFPGVIDSRGRILRPRPQVEEPGELSGMAVSAGIGTGPVKVLRYPHQKPIDKGDVLVAYTTDPGWTPLFVNAAAVVLEVGGVLQHGAVVAREYGKPCVVGIDRVTTKLHDGQRVEVNGTTGVIRILS